MLQVIDNFLPGADHDYIKQLMLHNTDFPWYYNDSVTYDGEQDVDDSQFTHMFYKNYTVNSSFFEHIKALIHKLNPSAILRIKANLNPYNGENKIHKYHVDVPFFNGKTAVYYVNTNNGATIFEDGTEVQSVENRIVIFNSTLKHAKRNATDVKARCVININFYPWHKSETNKELEENDHVFLVP